MTACLVSFVSGFRGGLFFSIFVGALIGKLFALGGQAGLPSLALDPTACIFAGIAALGVATAGSGKDGEDNQPDQFRELS